LVLKKDYEEARKAFEGCLRREPDYAPAHLELGMLCEEPFGDLYEAAIHYRAFVQLAPDHDQRPIVERWLVRVEERLLDELAAKYPGQVSGRDAAQLRNERDELQRRLRGAAVLYGELEDKNRELERQLAEARQEHVDDLKRDVASAVRSATVEPADVPREVASPPPTVVRAPPPEEPAPSVRVHTIVGGDTLAGISRQYYGTVQYWPQLQEYNQDTLKGKTMLIVGRTLKIPPLAELKKNR
jgi:nucleoid-associated protein YgaU